MAVTAGAVGQSSGLQLRLHQSVGAVGLTSACPFHPPTCFWLAGISGAGGASSDEYSDVEGTGGHTEVVYVKASACC